MTKKTLKKLLCLKKSNIGISCVTSYDASFAKLADESDIDIILVGDSLGEVIKGMRNTHSVTVDDICYHTKNVSQGIKYAYLIADMPINSYQTKKQALANALKITKNGMADMVKLESTPKQINIVKYLIENKIKVCGHIGIQPQKIANKKLYRKIGTTAGEANELIKEALLLQEAGAHILIAECIDGNCAKKIRNMLKIPLIGIGSGNNCDGQVRVIYDLFNISFNGSPGFMNNKRIKKNPFKDILMDYIKSTKKFLSN